MAAGSGRVHRRQRVELWHEAQNAPTAPSIEVRHSSSTDNQPDRCSSDVASAPPGDDAAVPRKLYATRAIFHGFPPTLIAAVLCCTRQTADHFKRGTRRPGATAMRLWTLYHNGRILGDEWHGWSARDGALFDPQGRRTTVAMLNAYAYVWDLARELARGNVYATEALDSYARLAYQAGLRSPGRSRKRVVGASVATTEPASSTHDV